MIELIELINRHYFLDSWIDKNYHYFMFGDKDIFNEEKEYLLIINLN